MTMTMTMTKKDTKSVLKTLLKSPENIKEYALKKTWFFQIDFLECSASISIKSGKFWSAKYLQTLFSLY